MNEVNNPIELEVIQESGCWDELHSGAREEVIIFPKGPEFLDVSVQNLHSQGFKKMKEIEDRVTDKVV